MGSNTSERSGQRSPSCPLWLVSAEATCHVENKCELGKERLYLEALLQRGEDTPGTGGQNTVTPRPVGFWGGGEESAGPGRMHVGVGQKEVGQTRVRGVTEASLLQGDPEEGPHGRGRDLEKERSQHPAPTSQCRASRLPLRHRRDWEGLTGLCWVPGAAGPHPALMERGSPVVSEGGRGTLSHPALRTRGAGAAHIPTALGPGPPAEVPRGF